MHLNEPDEFIRKAKRIIRRTGSRNPDRIIKELGITVIEALFKKQKGVYKVIERNRSIFLKDDLDPVMRGIVLLHEVGHDTLHREEGSIFQEFDLFDMKTNRMEYKANLFAAEIMLPDEEILEYIYQDYNAEKIAKTMYSDINLVALKVSELKIRNYPFRELEHRNDFLTR